MARRSLFALGLTALLLPGCLSFVNSCPKPPPEVRDACKSLPVASCQSVYVVLVNGADLLQCGNLQGVREYLACLGFTKTYYAQLYHESCLIKELAEVHREHPEARFVVIGFEHGAVPARKLTDAAAGKGLPVDLLVFLQPKTLSGETCAPNASCRVLTIVTDKSELTTAGLAQHQYVEVPCLSRYGVPTHPDTLTRLTSELLNLAENIPVNAPIIEMSPTIMEDPAPPPRPIKFANNERMDEWDFLKPVSFPKEPAGETIAG